MPGPSSAEPVGANTAVVSPSLEATPTEPSKGDVILAIVAALVVVGMVAVLYLKVLGPLGGE